MAHAEQATGAVGDGEVAVLHLDLRMGFAAQLAHGLDHLGHAAAIDRMVAAEPAAIGVERQLADAGDEVAVDSVGAGVGELVLLSSGSSARHVFSSPNEAIDLAIVGIVDTLSH